jgi:hypothetical protein
MQASTTVVKSSKPLMHKGCTRDAQGTCTMPIPDSQGGMEPEVQGEEASGAIAEKAGPPDYSLNTGVSDQVGTPDEGSLPNTSQEPPS